jgi:hypothetical protein
METPTSITPWALRLPRILFFALFTASINAMALLFSGESGRISQRAEVITPEMEG